MSPLFFPNLLLLGEPGSGKSFGMARYIQDFPGAVVLFDPQKESIAQTVLEHATGDVLFDRVSDLDHALGYDLLKPSTQRNPDKRMEENLRTARLFVDVMMRRRGGDIAGAPLMEEWIMALLLIYLYQE